MSEQVSAGKPPAPSSLAVQSTLAANTAASTGANEATKSSGADSQPPRDTVDSASHTDKKAKPRSKHQPVDNRQSLLTRVPWLAVLALFFVTALGYWILNKERRQRVALYSVERLLAQQAQANADRFLQLHGQWDQLRQELNQTREALQTSQTRAAEERLLLEAQVKQAQEAASAKGKDPLKWRIAEVDYLLALANQRLTLARDVGTATIALQDADKRLRAIADPGLNSIRQSLVTEIKAMESVRLPDLAGMALQLTALTSSIQLLPLVNRDRDSPLSAATADSTVDSWQAVPGLIWQQLRGLISIRRHDQPIEPLLPPNEQHYLSQNLGLKLEQSRLALLRGDTAVFRSNLDDTRQWVTHYFAVEASAVQTVLSTLETLSAVELAPTLPDISGSLRGLRRWAEQNHQGTGVVDPEPEAAVAPVTPADQSIESSR